MVEEIAAMDPLSERMTDHDASEMTCVFCGADDPAPHRLSCLWHRARLWLSHHPSPERETSGHEQTIRSRGRR